MSFAKHEVEHYTGLEKVIVTWNFSSRGVASISTTAVVVFSRNNLTLRVKNLSRKTTEAESFSE